MLHKVISAGLLSVGLAGAVLLSVGLAGAVQAENYLCVEEQVTGFAVQAGAWQETSFTPTRKWLVSIDERKATQFGDDYPTFSMNDCVAHWTEMICQRQTGQLVMSVETLRMLRTYT